jgi:hypothetical protein
MKLPFLGKRGPTTIASSKANEEEAKGINPEEKKVNIVDIGRLEDGKKETLTGYCSLSEDLEPCEWTFSRPKEAKDRPLMRILF